MECEKCGEYFPEFNGTYYKVDGKEYPRFENEKRGYNGNFNTHDWTEVHKCCGIEQEFDNGI